MASTKELEQQLEDLKNILDQHGIRPQRQAAETPEERADYVAHGSEQHAALLGLVKVDDLEAAQERGFYIFTSPETGTSYRLEDQVTPFMTYPDPAQVAKLTLQQKVSEFEAGKPPIAKGAPSLWRPADIPI